MEGIYELFELTREHELNPCSEDGMILCEDGVTQLQDVCGKTCFQVASQFDRPSEYLQSLLDMIRVNYEPCVLGDFFLNSNMVFLYDEIPDKPFQLGYMSITSMPNKQFDAFWKEDVLAYIAKCGYCIEDASSVFVAVSTGNERYDPDFIDDASDTLGSDFSIEEVVGLLAESGCESAEKPKRKMYAGYCRDSSLGNRIRLSLWLFINAHERAIQ